MYYDDDDADLEIAEDVAMTDLPEEVEDNLPEPDEQYGFYQVTCKCGCGTFPLAETEVLCVDQAQGTATFRCRACNDIQTAELLIVD